MQYTESTQPTILCITEVHEARGLIMAEAILLSQIRSIDFDVEEVIFCLASNDNDKAICSRHRESWIGNGIDLAGNKVRTYDTGEPTLDYTRSSVQKYGQNRVTIDIKMEEPCPSTPFFLSDITLPQPPCYEVNVTLGIDNWADAPDLQAQLRYFQRQEQELRSGPLRHLFNPVKSSEDRFLYLARKHSPEEGDFMPVSFIAEDREELALLQLIKKVGQGMFQSTLRPLREVDWSPHGTVLTRKVRWLEDNVAMELKKDIATIHVGVR